MSQLTYSEELTNPLWTEGKKPEVIAAAGGKCEDCGSALYLQAHHCAYIYGNKPWEYDDSLLMCVCPSCHAKRQKLENAMHAALGKLMRTLSPEELQTEAWKLIEEASIRQTERLANTFS